MNVKLAVKIALLMLLGSSPLASAQTIYEWQDEQGVRSYSDVPPESADVEDTGVEIARTDEEVVQARLSEQDEAYAKQREAKAQAAANAGKSDEQLAKQKAMREANCKQAKGTRDDYQRLRRIYRQTDDGEIEWMDIDEERVKAQEQVDKWCD